MLLFRRYQRGNAAAEQLFEVWSIGTTEWHGARKEGCTLHSQTFASISEFEVLF